MDYTKVNIHYLRTYAREIGVKSPSSCRKDVLIKKIEQVESGKVAPCFSKIGRPSQQKLNYDMKKERLENTQEKEIYFFIINKFREFLDKLEKEIKDKF